MTSVIQGSDGNLYGTMSNGGANDDGAVFKIGNAATTPTFDVIYNFTGGNDGASPGGVIQVAGGDLYGTTASGGESSGGTVFKIELSSAPTERVIHSFPGGNDASITGSLIQGLDGKLYGTARGGTVRADFVFSIDVRFGRPPIASSVPPARPVPIHGRSPGPPP